MPWRNSWPAQESARASRQHGQYPFGAEPTGQVTLTPNVRVTMAHFRTRPTMRAGVNGGSRAADAVMTRGDGSRWDECRPLTAACLQLLGHRT